MRHSKRKKLSTEDVERALKWYDAPPSLGHQHNESDPSYVQVPDVGRLRDGEAIFAPDEHVIGKLISRVDSKMTKRKRDINIWGTFFYFILSSY